MQCTRSFDTLPSNPDCTTIPDATTHCERLEPARQRAPKPSHMPSGERAYAAFTACAYAATRATAGGGSSGTATNPGSASTLRIHC